MAISVGSVEVDVIPNTQGIYARLRAGIVPAATRAGQDAGDAAGRAFGPAMQSQVGSIGLSIGQQIGQQIANRITAAIRDAMRDGITQGGAQARASAARQGGETGGAFARSLKARLEIAFRSLPKINIDADTTEADADLQALRVRMETLANQRIGIDIDAGAAKAEIKAIEAELKRLGARHPNVAVRADTAAALAQLAAVRTAIDDVDRRDVDIKVSTRQAVRALMHLSIMIAAIPVIPAVPVIAAGLGSIVAAATAAGAGLGAFAAAAVPAFMDIGKALQAQKVAQDAAATATAKGGQANAQAASRALQLAGAQQSLAAAERNGARQIAQAQDQVRDARQAVADAAAQGALRQQQAARAVQDAERNLASAQRDARQAQLDLVAARRTAAEQLEELNGRVAGAALDEREAVLRVKEARAELAKTTGDPKSTQLQREQAQLSYDRAVLSLQEQQKENRKLAVEVKAANAAGIEGSKPVRDAQAAIAAAQQQVADRARAVKDAQVDAGRVQVETARQIAQAQERVGEATENVAVAQQSAAEAVTSAQRQIQSAQLSAAGGADQAAVAQEKYQAALAKMTPSARGTFDAFVRLSGAFKEWSRSLQPAIMPIFTRALNGLKNSLPGLTPFVLAAARAISTLQDRVSRGFKSPWWKEFRDDLAGSVEPAIVGLGASIGRVFKGIGGVIQAFLPHMDSISSRMQRITGRFANWGSSLKGSPEFERFLSYSAEQAPILAEGLGKIGGAFYQVSHALAPLSGPVIKVLGVLADGIATVAEHAPWLVQGIWLAVIATKAWTLAMFLFNAVMRANPIVRIAILIGLLIAAVVYAYNRFGWFRTAVQAVWKAIQVAVSFAWNNILKPAFNGIWMALKFVGRIAMWLWKNAIGPAFKGIWTVAKFLFTILAVVVIGPLVLLFRGLAAVGKWLWKNVLAPAFKGIGAVFSWLWRTILKPYIGLIIIQFKALAVIGKWLWKTILKPAFEGIGKAAKWLWEKAIRPTFGWIADKAKWLWNKGIKPAFDLLRKGIGKVVDAFQAGKDGIGKAWDKLRGLTKKPVKWIIDVVYNKGVVGLWNAAASVLPIKKLKKFNTKGMARGGVIPGYQSAKRDDTLTPMRRGEGVLVPEVVRGIGADTVHTLNAAGNRGGVAAVRKAVGFATGGIIGDRPGFAEGGILGKIGGFLGKAKDWVLGGVAKVAEATARPIRDLIKRVPGGTTGFGQLATALPLKVLDEALSFIKGREQAELGGARVADALKWARSQHGKPYQWGGVGNPSWDCSGLLGGVQKVIQGKNPKGRLWSTFAFSGSRAPKGWKRGAASPFEIGITNRGKGHTAGTLGGTNVESRGGDGVLVGRRARGAYDPMFDARYGFLPARAGAIVRGSAQATARQMLGEFGFSQKQWPPLNELWKRESNWRWNAKNPSSGAYGIPQCVNLETMILTRRGWLAHDEVCVGDETIGYNPETGRSEWTPITHVHHGTGELRRFGTSWWSGVSTPNHRWLVERVEPLCSPPSADGTIPDGQCQCGCGGEVGHAKNTSPEKGIVKGQPNRYIHGHHARGRRRDPEAQNEYMVEQRHFKRRERIVLARPASTDSKLDITAQEAALLAWIAGDGWQQRPRPVKGRHPTKGYKSGSRAMTYFIAQTKEENWAAIDEAVGGNGRVARTRERHVKGGLRRDREWRLSAPYARDLTERAGNPKTDCVQQVLAMSNEQREAWLDAIVRAEGHVSPQRGGRQPVTQISQKAGPVAEAIVLAVYLSGRRPSVYVDKRINTGPVWTITITAPHTGEPRETVGGKPCYSDVSLGMQQVWCVTTGLGTWTARQGDDVFLTGNSLPASKMRSAGPDWLTNPATQIKWGLGYIKGRYGSPSKAWSFWQRQSPHWYDSGGYLPEGLSLSYNGTGRPERVLTGAQERALMGAAARGTDGGASGGEFTGDLYLDSGEFMGKVRGVVRSEFAPVVSTLRAK